MNEETIETRVRELDEDVTSRRGVVCRSKVENPGTVIGSNPTFTPK